MTTPPFAVPSNLVSVIEFTSVDTVNCVACSIAFCPVDASKTSITSCGAFGITLLITFLIFPNSFIRFTLLCNLPAVSIITTSALFAFAD